MQVNEFGELINCLDGVPYYVDGMVTEYCSYFEEMPIELIFTFEYRLE